MRYFCVHTWTRVWHTCFNRGGFYMQIIYRISVECRHLFRMKHIHISHSSFSFVHSVTELVTRVSRSRESRKLGLSGVLADKLWADTVPSLRVCRNISAPTLMPQITEYPTTFRYQLLHERPVNPQLFINRPIWNLEHIIVFIRSR